MSAKLVNYGGRLVALSSEEMAFLRELRKTYCEGRASVLEAGNRAGLHPRRLGFVEYIEGSSHPDRISFYGHIFGWHLTGEGENFLRIWDIGCDPNRQIRQAIK